MCSVHRDETAVQLRRKCLKCVPPVSFWVWRGKLPPIHAEITRVYGGDVHFFFIFSWFPHFPIFYFFSIFTWFFFCFSKSSDFLFHVFMNFFGFFCKLLLSLYLCLMQSWPRAALVVRFDSINPLLCSVLRYLLHIFGDCFYCVRWMKICVNMVTITFEFQAYMM